MNNINISKEMYKNKEDIFNQSGPQQLHQIKCRGITNYQKEERFEINFKNVHLNVAGATPNKVRELEVLIGDYSPDIICLCEHWLTSSAINVLNVTNYKLISSYCRILNKHGGDCIFSKNSIAKTIQFNKWKEKYSHYCYVQNTRVN